MQGSRILREDWQRLRGQIAASRGFTLTEVAIVLGIIGTVVVGLFAAFSVARSHVSTNQGSDELNVIVGNMRALNAGQAQAVPTIPVTAAFEQQLVAEKIFPSEMLFNHGAGNFAYNPWDQTAANGSAQISLLAAGGGQPERFMLEYLNLPPDACTDLLLHNSLPGADTGLVQINAADTTGTLNNTYSYNTAAGVYQLPVTPLVAAASCPDQVVIGGVVLVAAPIYNIKWFYTLGS